MPNDSKKKRQDHVALTEESIKKVNGWFDYIGSKKRGVKISRKDFINWLIARLPETPSSGDVGALVERFYDEEAFLRQLLREVKRTKQAGRESTLELVVRPKKIDSRRESGPAAPDENPSEDASPS